ncbi:MAG: DUF3592 domain-containing protein [Cellvibrio sp.]|uniref:DUF3592 domain-containing protein n=1 Tax=Cellvibrio sp. TaxID=1965322 RepID=UPI0031A3EC52
MKEKLKGRWFGILFGLPFAGVALAMLVLSIIPSLVEWQQMKSWPRVEAKLIETKLIRNQGDDSYTYQATASYRYRYQAQEYIGNRVAINSGADNIGDFHYELVRKLEAALERGRSVPAWVNPDNPADAVLNRDLRWSLLGFKLIFAAVFGLVGFGLIVWMFVARNPETNHPDSSEKPWLGRTEWASARVQCDTRSSLWGIWIFAIIWNLVSLPAVTAIPDELGQGNNLALLILLFPIAGFFLLYLAITITLSWRRFGQLVLEMDPYPGVIGGKVGGIIDLKLPFDSNQHFPVTLLCIRSYETGSGKNRSRNESVLWQSNGVAHTQLLPTGGTRLLTRFAVPKGLPVSEAYSSDYNFWRLDLKADLPGVDLHRQFNIPVFSTSVQPQLDIPLSDAHPHYQQIREEQVETITNLEQIHGGVRMHFPMLQRWGTNLTAMVVGLIFAIAGFALYQRGNAPAPLVWGFMFIGGFIALLCLKLLFSSLRVQLDANGLISERYWLGIPIGRDQIPRTEIVKLQINTSYKAQSSKGYTEVCKIRALTRSGKKIPVAVNLQGRDTAQVALEAIGSLSGYPIE